MTSARGSSAETSTGLRPRRPRRSSFEITLGSLPARPERRAGNSAYACQPWPPTCRCSRSGPCSCPGTTCRCTSSSRATAGWSRTCSRRPTTLRRSSASSPSGRPRGRAGRGPGPARRGVRRPGQRDHAFEDGRYLVESTGMLRFRVRSLRRDEAPYLPPRSSCCPSLPAWGRRAGRRGATGFDGYADALTEIGSRSGAGSLPRTRSPSRTLSPAPWCSTGRAAAAARVRRRGTQTRRRAGAAAPGDRADRRAGLRTRRRPAARHPAVGELAAGPQTQAVPVM